MMPRTGGAKRGGPWAALAAAVLLLVLATGALAVAWPAIRTVIVGTSGRSPDAFETDASPAARALVERALEGLDPRNVVDLHAHVAGSEADESGCELSPDMRSWLHPWRRIQYSIYLEACGVDDLERGAEQMVERLLAVQRAPPLAGRAFALALDHRVAEDGTIDRAGTALYVPNDFVLRLADEHPDVLLAGVSVHPYRRDALAELDRCADRGAKLVKWLPNSMGIDPASPRCDAFYERMRERGIVLLTHTGEEQALAGGSQEVGNPLRLRRALDHGVRVIVAHCASLGEAQDLDDSARKPVACFDLFLRMMGEERYRGLLYGELSAVLFRNRDPQVLRTLLERTDLHERLVDGTDWPLPAIRVMVSTRRFEREGFLTAEERAALDEVFEFDPRLFDLVLKRTVRGPGGERFPASVFEGGRGFAW
jgi:predicted TIM-barrel fold metal-dependent hydrolase